MQQGMAVNSTAQVTLHPNLAKIIAKYHYLDSQLSGFCRQLRDRLEAGNTEGIFPCQQSQVHNFLATLSNLDRKISQDLNVIAVTGRRALLALNGFIFGQTILEDEVFFRSRTLFTVTGHSTDNVTAKVHIYSKGALTLHNEYQFETLSEMNKKLAIELLNLELDKNSNFDGLLVEIGIPCPRLSRLRIAAASRVDTTIKELLDPHQQITAEQVQPSSNCLMLLHFFAPEMERRLSEAELSYVRNMASQSRLLLVCQHLRGKRAEVTEIVEIPEAKSNHNLCYFTQWKWDGLSSVQPEFEAALEDELRKRTTRLGKTVTKELKVPFQVVHQIKRNINLSRNVAKKQRRNSREYMKDFANLQSKASRLSKEFQRLSEKLLTDTSENVAQHLRIGRIRSRIIEKIIARSAELKGSSEHKIEIAFLEVVSEEVRDWNNRTDVLNKADEEVNREKINRFKDLCTQAAEIPEIILISSDMLNDSSESTGNSTNSSKELVRRPTITSVMDDMVRRRLRTGRLETFAAGIAAPLWLPLAAITMAIIVPVIGAQNREQSDEKFKIELRGLAQDFLDRLDSQLIRRQFFDRVKKRLDDEAKQLRDFIECFCILPANYELSKNARLNEESLTQRLVELEQQLQHIQGQLMMLQLEKLQCDVLSKEDCVSFGVDINVTKREQLGEELVNGKPIYLVSPQGAEKPLVLKLAPGTGTQSHRLLLEIEILKTVSFEKQNNIIPWLGTVYFPHLQTVGFLTYKYDFDLWQFLKHFGHKAIPAQNEICSPSWGAAFAVCRESCHQIFSGVLQLHNRQILHRDLKPENVLIEVQKATEPLRFVAKLCDFGLAKHENEMSGSTFGGTNGYMAPEVVQARPAYSNKSDIYALGVIAWECFFGRRVRENEAELRESRCGDGAWNYLVQTMTEPRPNDRPLIEQCLVLLKQLDKKPEDQGGVLLSGLTRQTVPSIKESLMVLSITKQK